MRKYTWVWIPRILKSGLRGKTGHFECHPYSVIDQCEYCGRWSSADWVKRWYLPKGRRNSDEEPVLCMGCLNRIRPMWKRFADHDRAHRAMWALKREITNVRRNQKCR